MASADSDALNERELALWICLNQVHGLGSHGFCKLLQAFGSPEQIYATNYSQLLTIVAEPIAEQIRLGPNLDSAAPTLQWLENSDNHLITLADKDYPQTLLEISDPPPVLFAKGNLHWLNSASIAVVGSRNASPQGEKNAEEFSLALCQQGYTIVSGMALGIDGAAHRGALKASGATVAVVGTGLDIVYPARHRDLAHQIVERGVIISEFALGTPSRAQNFPRRNRIISGLGLGCLVVEANVQSGSLITAKLAAEQGREVFAIPGSIHSPMSKGCHELIKQGAKLVDSIKDIIDELGCIATNQFPAMTLPGSQLNSASQTNPLLECIGFDPVSMESLVERSGLTSEHLSAMLLMLELENKVASLPGGRYQRIA